MLVAVFLETTALVGFVIHGELALLVGGVAAERGDVALPAIIALAAAAAVAGDLVSFLLGRRLGRPFLERHGPRVGVGPDRLARIDAFFARHGGKAVFLGRFTGSCARPCRSRPAARACARGSCSPSARSARSSGPTVFTLIGYAFAESFTAAGQTATRIALVAVLLAIAALVARSRLARRWVSGLRAAAARALVLLLGLALRVRVRPVLGDRPRGDQHGVLGGLRRRVEVERALERAQRALGSSSTLSRYWPSRRHVSALAGCSPTARSNAFWASSRRPRASSM